jgi:Zn-dependent M28 family amino/carboxypeptidase
MSGRSREAGGILLAAALAILAAMAAAQAPKAVTFDGNRAYEHLRQVVGIGPRPAGSVALESTRAYIRKQLSALGITATEQAFDADTPVGRLHMVNLIARIPGTSPDRIIFAGHYDTKLFREFRFVGADDAGSSTAFLLEWARVLKARRNRFTAELLFLDGEEATRAEWVDPDNRYGSRHYVQAAIGDRTLATIRAMILVDMVGDRDLHVRKEAESTPWLTDTIWAVARKLKLQDVFLDETTPIEDDHNLFLQAGVPAVDIIDLDYPPWHTAADTLDKVSARSMQAVGDVLLNALPEIEGHLASTAAPPKK